MPVGRGLGRESERRSGQLNPEAGTALGTLLRADTPVMRFGDGFDDGESEAEAILGGAGRVRAAHVRSEQVVSALRRQPRAAVFDKDAPRAAGARLAAGEEAQPTRPT